MIERDWHILLSLRSSSEEVEDDEFFIAFVFYSNTILNLSKSYRKICFVKMNFLDYSLVVQGYILKYKFEAKS